MTTSGTVGATVIDTTTFIEHAVRRCGVSASIITAEQVTSARENLYILLNDLANRGVNLWCIQKNILALAVGQGALTLPVGTVDVLRTNLRTTSYPTGTQVVGAGYVSIDFGYGTTQAVATVGLTMPSSGTYSFVVESSPDGVSWTQQGAWPAVLVVTAGQQVWYDVDNATPVEFWRLRELTAQSLSGATVVFGTAPSEVPMAKLSHDSYSTLPNKLFQSATPLQFWYDKQYSQPRLWLWPVPSDPTKQVVCWCHRHIQDVGTLSSTLELPSRWYQTVLYQLAHLIGFEMPSVTPAMRAELKALADEHLLRAEDGERDGAPITYAPRIGCYTA